MNTAIVQGERNAAHPVRARRLDSVEHGASRMMPVDRSRHVMLA